MATAATTKTAPESTVPELAVTIRAQALSTVRQGQQLSIDAAQAWVKAASVLPTPGLSKVPDFAARPGAQALSNVGFDVAVDLLNAHRDYVSKLVGVLVPAQAV